MLYQIADGKGRQEGCQKTDPSKGGASFDNPLYDPTRHWHDRILTGTSPAQGRTRPPFWPHPEACSQVFVFMEFDRRLGRPPRVHRSAKLQDLRVSSSSTSGWNAATNAKSAKRVGVSRRFSLAGLSMETLFDMCRRFSGAGLALKGSQSTISRELVDIKTTST